MGTVLMGRLKAEGKTLADCKITTAHFTELLKYVNDGTISNNTAKSTVFEAMYSKGEDPDTIIKREGLKQVSDSGELEALIEKTLSENPQPVADYKAGKQNAIGFLVGQVMKASKGQANPQMVNELVRKKLAL